MVYVLPLQWRIDAVIQDVHLPYCRKVWQIDSFRAFGEGKFGKLVDQPIACSNLDDNSLANHARLAKFTKLFLL